MINTEVNSIDEIINILKTSKKQIYRFDINSSKNTALKKEALNNLQKFKNFCESELGLSSKDLNQDFTGIQSNTHSESVTGNAEIYIIWCCYSLQVPLPDSYSQTINIKLLIFNKSYAVSPSWRTPPIDISYQLWVGDDVLIHVNDFNTFESKFKEWLEEDN